MRSFRSLMVAALASAFVFGAGHDAFANRRSPTPRAQRSKKPRAANARRPKAANRIKAKAAAVKFEKPFAGKRITDQAIVKAVRTGFADYLREVKGGMGLTRAEWNRMDPASVRVKSVTINKASRWELEKGERMFTATIEVKQVENGKPRVTTARVSSVIHLGPRLPSFYGERVKGTPELKAEDVRRLGDSSTAGWID
jgi:hypothetical protein